MKYIKFLFVIAGICIGSNAFAQTQPTVLVESFTNDACTNCRPNDDKLDAACARDSSIVALYIHNYNADPKDPFYLASKSSADYRSGTFWNTPGDPWAYVNGFDGNNTFSQWNQAISAVNRSFGAHLAMTNLQIIGDSVKFSVHCTGSSNGVSVRLYVALSESNIYYFNPNATTYGNPPGSIWNNIFRRMLPAPGGSSLFTLSGGEQDFNIAFDTAGTGWNIANMKAIAFLEPDVVNDEADFQALAVFRFPTLGVQSQPTIARSALGNPTPNPFTSASQVPITVGQAGQVKIVITDLLGRVVATPSDRFLPAGHSYVTLDGAALPAGLYQARMYVDGVIASMTKLMKIQ